MDQEQADRDRRMQTRVEQTFQKLAEKLGVGGEDRVRVDLLTHLYGIVRGASVYWRLCPDDFCFQNADGEIIVFGSVNRIVWSPTFGYQISSLHCTPAFRTRYAIIGPLPKDTAF